MNKIEIFWWIIKQGLGGILAFWPLTLLLCIIFTVSIIWDSRKINSLKQIPYLISFSIINPFIIAFLGTVFKDADQNTLPQILVFTLLIMPILLNCKSIIIKKENRFTRITIIILGGWISLWIAFISLMSIVDDWI